MSLLKLQEIFSMNHLLCSILLAGLLFFSAPQTFAQASHTQADTLLVVRTGNFDINGKGDAPQWRRAREVTLTKRKGAADYQTRAKLMYSETGIYVLFSCEDDEITATLREDFAELWKEDVVEIFLWTDSSASIYFEYELSPLNYELPILVPNFGGTFYGWRPWQYEGARKVRHATHVVRDASGETTAWIAEFIIPYALLKPLRNVPPQKGMIWRINMYRNDFDHDYTSWSWNPVDTNYHDYQNFGVIRFE